MPLVRLSRRLSSWRRRWRGRPLALRIAIVASALALSIVLAVGTVSYEILRSSVRTAVDGTISVQSTMAARQLEADLSAIIKTFTGLSRNALLINALMDSVARRAYLEPFLQDFTWLNGAAVDVTLVNFMGRRVAGNPQLAINGTGWQKLVLEQGIPRARLEERGDRQFLVVAEPIFYFRTRSPEGAIVYRVALQELLARAIRDATIQANQGGPDAADEKPLSTLHLRAGEPPDASRSARAPGAQGLMTSVRPILLGNHFTDFDLELVATADRQAAQQPLNTLLLSYLVIGFLLLAATLLAARAAGRRLAAPLLELEQVARAVVVSGSLDHRFNDEGPQEIVRLGQTFNAMLQRLADAQGELADQVRSDSLTGLANRKGFDERLQTSVAHAQRTGLPMALMLIDIDHFKEINDLFGHPTGDALLRDVAERLRRQVRETDVVARLGGDEFAIIATDLASSGDVHPLLTRIRGALERPYLVDQESLSVTSSGGIALLPEDAADALGLYKSADLALYEAKSEGRDCFRFYNAAMDETFLRNRRFERRIKALLQEDTFDLQFQPKFDIKTGAVVGAEALLRTPPSMAEATIPDLVGVAESTGLIHAIGEWVLQRVCRELVAWRATGKALLPVAVNISPVQLRRPDFVDRVMALLERSQVSPRLIELEVTESAAMDRADRVIETLARLHELGFTLSIDDFGTGYSSLAYLKRFPVDKLKIDASFIGGVPSSIDDVAISRAILALASNLGLEVIAEGVETEEQLRFLRRHRCRYAQGYLLARPMSGEEFLKLLPMQADMATRPASPVAAGPPRGRPTPSAPDPGHASALSAAAQIEAM